MGPYNATATTSRWHMMKRLRESKSHDARQRICFMTQRAARTAAVWRLRMRTRTPGELRRARAPLRCPNDMMVCAATTAGLDPPLTRMPSTTPIAQHLWESLNESDHPLANFARRYAAANRGSTEQIFEHVIDMLMLDASRPLLDVCLAAAPPPAT